MSAEQCFMSVCFIPLDATGSKFFGFSEFLAGLALMVLAWTTGDVRYRFRVQTAPIPLRGITFSVVTAVGILTLLTDLWRAEQWLVPRGNLLTPASWQAVLGALFLLTFLTWAWFAFIQPPIYGKRNAERFAVTLYRVILKGSPSELAVIADELSRSAGALVHHAMIKAEIRDHQVEPRERARKEPTKVVAYASDLMLLIADKRLCRAIVESSPGTALAVFQAMGKAEKYGVHVDTFAKNIMNEALKNRDSFIFHEAEGYESGLMGYHKPLSQAMFSTYKLVEVVGTIFDPELGVKWDATQWEAYCRVVLMTFSDYVDKQMWNHSVVLYRAMGNIESSVSDLQTLNGVANSAWDSDVLDRVRVAVNFINRAVEILDKKGVPRYVRLRIHEGNEPSRQSIYDNLAVMIAEVVFAASSVTSPWWESWIVQHNSVWSRLLGDHKQSSAASKIIAHKARRLLYNEVVGRRSLPSFRGAKALGLFLNVLGLTLRKDGYGSRSWPLHKAILSWTQTNYMRLRAHNQKLAEACLVDSMSYDAEKMRIVKTYPIEGFRNEERYEYLDLTPAPLEVKEG